MPSLFVIAGPNGAGKSTIAETLLTGSRKVQAFVNADVIAAEIGGVPGAATDIKAGRIMLERLDALMADKADVAFESTLASRSLLARIGAMREAGYLFHLIFLWLPSAEMAVQRVVSRVRDGGHGIAEAVVRRRYERSLANFFNLYRPVADSWLMLDNSGVPDPKPIAWRNVGGPVHIVREGPWEQLRSRYEIDPIG
jgi:predicted ABC-type ATPase